MKGRINELRKTFQGLNFFTDSEIENLLTVIRSVSLGTKMKPQEILSYLDRAWKSRAGNC